jgi:hypothetical protein
VFAVLSHDPKLCISKAALIIAGITPVTATPALAKAHTALFQQALQRSLDANSLEQPAPPEIHFADEGMFATRLTRFCS